MPCGHLVRDRAPVVAELKWGVCPQVPPVASRDPKFEVFSWETQPWAPTLRVLGSELCRGARSQATVARDRAPNYNEG